MGLPFDFAMSAAAPAVEPKSTLFELRNSSDLLDPRLLVHSTRMPSLARDLSRKPFSFSSRPTGL
jgi:hypothetical protein